MPCLDFVAGSAFAFECAGLGAGRGDGFRPIAEGVEMLYVRLAVADAGQGRQNTDQRCLNYKQNCN